MKKTKAETPAENLQEPKAWADGIPVYCSHDAIVAVADSKRDGLRKKDAESNAAARTDYGGGVSRERRL